MTREGSSNQVLTSDAPAAFGYNSSMHAALLLAPLAHGAAGFWDEVINLVPIVIGAALLLYLYRTSRRRASGQADEPHDQDLPQ